MTERRAWGFWTVHKLDILGDYLNAFNTASLRAGKTVYLDLYAGTTDNEERDTGRPVLGSAQRALEASPFFTRLYLFDLPQTAGTLESELRATYADRDFMVVSGDSNDTVTVALDDIRQRDLQWAPIFAFLDPYKLDIKWKTLEVLADFKRERKYKVELWILCFSSTMPRVLTTNEEPDATGARQLSEFFGSEQWREIHNARVAGRLSPGDAREEYVNLYRWRLENTLGYKYTHAFAVKNTHGPLYHLVFATDNDAGFKIMRDLYAKATRQHEPMRREAIERERQRRDEGRGIHSLFGPEELAASGAAEAEYHHEPPWPPLGTTANG